MAKKKKTKLGALGPAPHWLDMSLAERAKTKIYIKEGLQGYERDDGTKIPSARRIYSGLKASDGFDLRHVERWSAAKLRTARNRIQSLNTLTSRPFAVIIPRTKKQKREAQNFTGQNLKHQKGFIVHVQIQNRDKAVFRDGKVGIERKFPSGSKTIRQQYLFKDYLRPDESLRAQLKGKKNYKDDILDSPTTFREMKEVTKRMLLHMPKNLYGQPAYYTILNIKYGPIGRTVTHGKVQELLIEYFNRYDPGGLQHEGGAAHEGFAESIIGFQMIGNKVQKDQFQREVERLRQMRKQRKRLRFSLKKKPTMCLYINKKTGRRCERKIGHKGKHRFPK